MVVPLDDKPRPAPGTPARLARLVPLAIIVLITGTVIAMGWHQQLSLEALVRHRVAIDAFVTDHRLAALFAFAGIYFVAVALSLPGAVFLTIAGGLVFGAVPAALAVLVGATAGATVIFLIARSAVGGWLARRAGPLAEKLAEGFRADAFNYLLFLRLVPLFPFWLVNLVPALCGVRLGVFVAATAIGIIPGTLAFSFFGAGLDSVLAAQAAAYNACIAAGGADCRLDFDLKTAATPQLLAGLAALGALALVPILVKRIRGARGRGTHGGTSNT